jgi:3-dehydroquinate synthetase
MSLVKDESTETRFVPLERAPRNVFKREVFRYKDEQFPETQGPRAGNIAKIVHWRNCFPLPIEYSVYLCDPLLRAENALLGECLLPANLSRRFCVVDDSVWAIYGEKLKAYFDERNIASKYLVLPGGEEHKNIGAVFQVLDALCDFGLHRREPILAIGGGVVLDIAGFAASLYRRGVPYIRVPTTLLAIVDASVGVKTGIDYTHTVTDEHFKNRMGAFYAPVASFLDKTFVATQDERQIINGLGEILKLALVRSAELFALLEEHAADLVRMKFQQSFVPDRVIELSVEIMLEELGPNLWEQKLERCVDYGHTFSKVLEMKCLGELCHGEAVNIDGFFCVLLSEGRGWLDTRTRNRILRVMRDCCRLPFYHPLCEDVDTMWQAVMDGIEHRDGLQRIPLIYHEIGRCTFVNDLTKDEIKVAAQKLVHIKKNLSEAQASQ